MEFKRCALPGCPDVDKILRERSAKSNLNVPVHIRLEMPVVFDGILKLTQEQAELLKDKKLDVSLLFDQIDFGELDCEELLARVVWSNMVSD